MIEDRTKGNWRRAGAMMGLLALGACSWGGDTVEEPQPAPVEATYPDVNTVPTERPEPIIVDIFAAPQGLKADTANADHTEELDGGPTSSAEPPPPPPPPPPPEPVAEPSGEPSADPAAEPIAPTAEPSTEPEAEPSAAPDDQQQSVIPAPSKGAEAG